MATQSYQAPPQDPSLSPRPKRRFLALKIVGGVIALAVVVLGGAAIIDTYVIGTDSSDSAVAPPLTRATAPDLLDAAAFSTSLSTAASGTDEAAFLALFAPALHTDATRYFANLRTMDVDRVLAVLETDGTAALGGESIAASLRIGLHVKGVDGVETSPREPMPGMAAETARTPSTDYTVTITRTDGGTGVIEAWAPTAGPAPWDVQELAAVRGDGFVLATGVDNRALLDTFRPATTTAVDYIAPLFSAVYDGLGPASGLDNPGFLVFVEPDDAQFSSYFSSDRTAGPISEAAGYAISLPSASGDSAGSRVVMRPQDDVNTFASITVHELVHVMYASGPNVSFLPAGQVDPGVAWVAEGIAEWVQTRYADQDFTGPTRDAVRAAVAADAFQDRPPTHDELYQQPEVGYPMAASVFEWIAETSGEAAAFDAASRTLQIGVDELFFNLPPVDGGDPQAAWAAWVRTL